MGEHLIDGPDGKLIFKSDKYPWSKEGFVPLKLTDPMAFVELWHYAENLESGDWGLADLLKTALRGEGEYQSVEHPWCQPGFVPMEVSDPKAQPALWNYAGVREVIDQEFSDDLREALKAAGYQPREAGNAEA